MGLLFDVFPLRGKELRGWLTTSGSGLFTNVRTGYEALQMLRDMGAAIRTQDFYEIRRFVLARESFGQTISDIGYDQLIPMAFHQDDHGWDIQSNFLYTVKLTGIDPNTYHTTERYVSVASDNQLTQQQVIDSAFAEVNELEEEYGIIASAATIESALVKPGVNK